VVGQVTQVDICPDDAGFVLSFGPVSLCLSLTDALDVADTLAKALARQVEAADEEGGLATPSAPEDVVGSPPRGPDRSSS
jgi:hypothetical protein